MWPFKKQPKAFAPSDDYCWLTAEELNAGVAAQAMAALAAGPVLVVVHFPNTIDEAGDAVAAAGAEVELTRASTDASALKSQLQQLGPNRVLIALSSHLKPSLSTATDDVPIGSSGNHPPLTILAWERHPLRSRDDAVTVFAAELNRFFTCSLRFNCAMDRPPLSMFAGETTMRILQRLGMKPGDHIDHPMLSKSVLNAQEKIAENISTDPRPAAASAQEWFEAWKLSNP